MAVQGPGIDTRIWSSLAYVTAVHVDPENGPLADVLLVPSQHTDTARFGSDYAGVGVGIFFPLAVDDEVVVECPSGDPNEGWVIVARVSSASDLQPAGWDNDSVTLYSDQPIQILGSKVRLGAPPNSGQPGANSEMADVALLSSVYRPAEDNVLGQIQAALDAVSVALNTISTTPCVVGSPVLTSKQALDVANPVKAMDSAVAAFQGNSSYLSKSVEFGK
jgi:hypothetical protein